jgi:hypothetical protein
VFPHDRFRGFSASVPIIVKFTHLGLLVQLVYPIVVVSIGLVVWFVPGVVHVFVPSYLFQSALLLNGWLASLSSAYIPIVPLFSV